METKNTDTQKKTSRLPKVIFLVVTILIALWIFRGQQRYATLSDFWNRDLEATLQKAEKENRNVFVFFMAKQQNSTTIRMIKDSLEEGPGVRNQMQRSNYLAVVAIVDRGLSDSVSKKYDIKELPTIMVLSPRGKILAREKGFVGHANVTSMLVKYAKEK